MIKMAMVQSKSGKMYDASSPQGKMIVTAATTGPDASFDVSTPFKKGSPALKNGSSGILESILAVVTESSGYLKAMAPSQSEIRGESIEDANVAPDPNEGRDDAPAVKGPGVLGRLKNKFSMGGLLKTGLIAAMAGLMLFSEKFAKALEPVLKWIKEDVFPAAVASAKWALDKLTSAFNAIKAAFKFLTDPETSLEEKMAGVKQAMKDFGAWLLGLFDNLATKIATAFGMEFEEGETLGSWVGDKLKEGWANIKAWFEGIAPAWLIDGAKGVGAWVLAKITGVFKIFKEWFGEASEAWSEGGVKGVWQWLKKKVGDAFQTIIDWFTSGDALVWTVDGAKGIWAWLTGMVGKAWGVIKGWFGFGEKDKDKEGSDLPKTGIGDWLWTNAIEPMWTWIKGLFTNPVDALKKLLDAYIGVYAAIGTFIWDKAIKPVWTWIKGLFTFGKKEDEKLTDEDGDEISLGSLAASAVGVVWAWIKDKFTFDIPKMKLPKLPNFKDMIMGVVGSMLPELDSWLWGPLPNKLKVFREYYESQEAIKSSEIQAVPNGAAAALATESAYLEASGAATMFFDNRTNTDNSSTSGDTLVADLAADHGETTVRAAGNKDHLRNK